MLLVYTVKFGNHQNDKNLAQSCSKSCVLSKKKESEFSLYFHFLGSDVRDHLFRSEYRLIFECSLRRKE